MIQRILNSRIAQVILLIIAILLAPLAEAVLAIIQAHTEVWMAVLSVVALAALGFALLSVGPDGGR